MINQHNYYQNTFGKFRCIKSLPKDVIQLNSPSPSSTYYVSQDGKTLYRVSNHWSLSECHFIASCVWILLDTKGKQNYGKQRIGMIKFSNLKSTEPLQLKTRIGYRSGKEIIDVNSKNLTIVEKTSKVRMSKR